MLLPVYVVNSSKKSDPTTEFPDLSRPGDHTAKVISLGITAIIPPPTPLFAGNPTLYANFPTASYVPQVKSNEFTFYFVYKIKYADHLSVFRYLQEN